MPTPSAVSTAGNFSSGVANSSNFTLPQGANQFGGNAENLGGGLGVIANKTFAAIWPTVEAQVENSVEKNANKLNFKTKSSKEKEEQTKAFKKTCVALAKEGPASKELVLNALSKDVKITLDPNLAGDGTQINYDANNQKFKLAAIKVFKSQKGFEINIGSLKHLFTHLSQPEKLPDQITLEKCAKAFKQLATETYACVISLIRGTPVPANCAKLEGAVSGYADRKFPAGSVPQGLTATQENMAKAAYALEITEAVIADVQGINNKNADLTVANMQRTGQNELVPGVRNFNNLINQMEDHAFRNENPESVLTALCPEFVATEASAKNLNNQSSKQKTKS